MSDTAGSAVTERSMTEPPADAVEPTTGREAAARSENELGGHRSTSVSTLTNQGQKRCPEATVDRRATATAPQSAAST